jgi:hypothetical protein
VRYYKIESDKYILAIGIGNSGVEITESEYNHIKVIVSNCPTAPDGFVYRLTAEFEWELYELPIAEETDEISEAEALEILLGGAI